MTNFTPLTFAVTFKISIVICQGCKMRSGIKGSGSAIRQSYLLILSEDIVDMLCLL